MWPNLAVGDTLPGGFVVVYVTETTITIQGPAFGGVPTGITFNKSQFNEGFAALLTLLGIPYP